MPDPRRQLIQAQLELIGARLDLLRSEQGIKRANLAFGCVSMPTAIHVLQGKDHKVSTLLKIADSLECDVRIEIVKRSA